MKTDRIARPTALTASDKARLGASLRTAAPQRHWLFRAVTPRDILIALPTLAVVIELVKVIA
jgi:hypothetical protein